MKYRIKHDCDGYRIQESLLGLVWFDSSVDRFYRAPGDCVAKYSITSSRFYATKEDVMEVAKRLKLRLKYRGHRIVADRNYYVDVSSSEFFGDYYSRWARDLDTLKAMIDKFEDHKRNKKESEIIPV